MLVHLKGLELLQPARCLPDGIGSTRPIELPVAIVYPIRCKTPIAQNSD